MRLHNSREEFNVYKSIFPIIMEELNIERRYELYEEWKWRDHRIKISTSGSLFKYKHV
jgi:hypothetical protein